jgi:hypothetical protein
LARAKALESSTSQGAAADAVRVRALAAWKEFLIRWKDADADADPDADPDVPILKRVARSMASRTTKLLAS